jgi:hypothetical protein
MSWISGDDCQDAVWRILREPAHQRSCAGESKQNQFGGRQFLMPGADVCSTLNDTLDGVTRHLV